MRQQALTTNISQQATELEIIAKLMLHTKETLNTYMANFCDQPIEKLRIDTDRDFYMTPNEALAYGLIDEVIQHKNMIKDPKIPSLRVIYFFPPVYIEPKLFSINYSL